MKKSSIISNLLNRVDNCYVAVNNTTVFISSIDNIQLSATREFLNQFSREDLMLLLSGEEINHALDTSNLSEFVLIEEVEEMETPIYSGFKVPDVKEVIVDEHEFPKVKSKMKLLIIGLSIGLSMFSCAKINKPNEIFDETKLDSVVNSVVNSVSDSVVDSVSDSVPETVLLTKYDSLSIELLTIQRNYMNLLIKNDSLVKANININNALKHQNEMIRKHQIK